MEEGLKSIHKFVANCDARKLIVKSHCKIVIISIIHLWCMIIARPEINAQGKLNSGLEKPQDASTLPRSLAPLSKTVQLKQVPLKTVLSKLSATEFALKEGWYLCPASQIKGGGAMISQTGINVKKWYNAVVPGTVLTTLVQQGVYPDPYFGLNNLYIPDSLCRKDWWYRISFNVPEGKKQAVSWLGFKGINYEAVVWLNGKEIGTIKGAFQSARFNITDNLKTRGENVLAVYIIPPPNPGIPHEESSSAGQGPNGGVLCLDGPTFISSEGWDWVPGIRDRNIGIWQDVTLSFTGSVSIRDPQVITDLPLPDTSSARIILRTKLKNNDRYQAKQVLVTASIENIKVQQNVTLAANETKEISFDPTLFPAALHLKHPRLWWPNGYGKQELYTAEFAVKENDKLSDQKSVRFGVRELSYELSVDAPHHKDWRIEYDPTDVSAQTNQPLFHTRNRRLVTGETFIPSLRPGVDLSLLKELPTQETAPYLVIKVNGKRVYCKGGNWGMDDGMKRVSKQRLEPYFKLHKKANLNMVRNWTGESTQESFFELCDEYGMLVWNDFWLSTEGYNLIPSDHALFLENAKDVITRFRNHASIALWCPRNEGYAPAELEDSLANMIVALDGTRLYQANSRYLNLRTSGPWHYQKDPAVYFHRIADGFSTELGAPSIPTAASMRKMMSHEDVWPISDVWYYHDLHGGQKDYLKAIDSLYGHSDNLEDFCAKAQMLNYDTHRTMFEAWNSKLWNNSSGLLLWMTHPAWPSTVWQIYSWDYETFGSYFGSKKAAEPIHVQMNLHDSSVVAINTTLQKIQGSVTKLTIYDLQGKVAHETMLHQDIEPNQLTYLFKPALPASLPGVYLCRLTLTDANGNILSQNEYWKTGSGNFDYKAMNKLPKVALQAKVLENNSGKVKLSVINASAAPAISIKLNLVDVHSNRIILPAYFSEGYFNLMPGESKTVEVDHTESKRNTAIGIMAEGYNVPVHTIMQLK